MAKQLVFRLDDEEIALDMEKVDRSKLYGYKDRLVLDEDGEPCELVTLAGDGRTMVGKGGIAMAYVSADREWCNKADLTPIDLDGEVMRPVPSTFNAPVVLDQTAGIQDYLDHDIRSVYLLTSEDELGALRARLEAGAIFRFDFSYRGGLEADAAFLLTGSDGNVFMAIGRPATTTYVGLQESAGMAAQADSEDDEDEDEDDFGFGVI